MEFLIRIIWIKRKNWQNILYFLTLFFTFWIIYNLQNKHFNRCFYKDLDNSYKTKLLKIRHREGFQKVSENFWIYSAYHVYNQTNDSIIVHGIYLNTRLKEYEELKLKAITCRIQNGDNFDDFFITFVEFKLLEENDRKYIAVQIVCKTQEWTRNLRNFSWVSIMLSKSDENFENFLPIKYNPRYRTQFGKNQMENFEFKYNLSLCIRPTFNFDNFGDFIEFIEIYRLVGVDHFTLYNQSIGPKISCLVNAPEYQNFLTIVPWTDPLNLDPVSLEGIYQKGQMLAETDCLYGYRGLSKFVGFVDFDEFILPRKSQNLYKFLTENFEEIAEFRFKNSFFIPPTTDISESHGVGDVLKNLKIINWTKRTLTTSSCCDRTKFIVQPEKVSTIKVHFVLEMFGKSIIVSPNLAFIHHYRRPNSNIDHKMIILEAKNLTDNYSRNKFGGKLASRVQSRIKNIHKNCLKSLA